MNSPQKNTPEDVRKVNDHHFEVPTFRMTDNGPSFSGRVSIKLVKGVPSDPGITRQDGFLPQTFRALMDELYPKVDADFDGLPKPEHFSSENDGPQQCSEDPEPVKFNDPQESVAE